MSSSIFKNETSDENGAGDAANSTVLKSAFENARSDGAQVQLLRADPSRPQLPPHDLDPVESEIDTPIECAATVRTDGMEVATAASLQRRRAKRKVFLALAETYRKLAADLETISDVRGASAWRPCHEGRPAFASAGVRASWRDTACPT